MEGMVYMLVFNLFKYFSENLENVIENYFNNIAKPSEYMALEEIRIRSNRPLILKFNDGEKIFDYIVTVEDLIETLQRICENSIYSYQSQICNGFITIKGGHRVGISGNVVIENGKIININYISSLNFRIAKEINGCSNKLLKYVINIDSNNIYNTLIVSKPGVGKTTILRDLIKKISNGIEQINFYGLNVGLVDERGEIAAMYKGVAQNDIGIRTDVLSNVKKDKGMKLLIRSMAPRVIAADEIGSKEDIEAIKEAVCSGIKGIFTAHGSSLDDISINPSIKDLLMSHVIERIIFLDSKKAKGEIEKVYALNKINSEYVVY